jgi:thiol-disulfide isomerase/thioredoxin
MEYIRVTNENIEKEHICCAISNNNDLQVSSKKNWHGRQQKQRKKGLCILAAAKKKPFLADPEFLKYKGFTVSDEADNGILLWHLSFTENALAPKFKECAKYPHIDETGYVLYYTSQCPFNAKYVPVIENIAKERSVKFKAIHLQNKEDAQNAPTPITTYALFLDGSYITNEQMNDKRFLKLLEK